MCGECGDNGETVTCAEANGGLVSCRLRFLYCLQPYGSPPVSVSFPLPQGPLNLEGESNTFVFKESLIIQIGDSTMANSWNRSNPFTRNLQTWPVICYMYTILSELFCFSVLYLYLIAGADSVLCSFIPTYIQR